MDIKAAVLISRQGAAPRPSMMTPLLFRPVFGWAAQILFAVGIRKVCPLCAQGEEQAAGALLSGGQELISPDGERGPVLIITRPALPAAQAMKKACDTALALGASAVALNDSDGARTGMYFMPDIGLDWVMSRLMNPEGFERALIDEGIAFGEATCADVVALETPAQFNLAQQALKTAAVARHMESGVIFLDPGSALIGPQVTIGADTVILPGVILRGKTEIGAGCEIGPNALIEDTQIGDRCVVNSSQIYKCKIGCDVKIGPYAYMRPDCVIADGVKIGDFVDLKNAHIGTGTKVPHLSYVGDARVGSGVNFSCGAITANYDGMKKHITRIGDKCFIGSNSNLVAPVTVGEGAYVAAGSTITKDVPPDALSIARAYQVDKEGWAGAKRSRGEIK